MRAALSSLLLLIAACEHSSPFTFVPGTQGPWGGGLPRRLTFSAGDDRNAAVAGGLIVFSRLEASALATRERCLALLPVDGGTLRGEYCPRLPTTLADTFLDRVWTEGDVRSEEPELDPDRNQLERQTVRDHVHRHWIGQHPRARRATQRQISMRGVG